MTGIKSYKILKKIMLATISYNTFVHCPCNLISKQPFFDIIMLLAFFTEFDVSDVIFPADVSTSQETRCHHSISGWPVLSWADSERVPNSSCTVSAFASVSLQAWAFSQPSCISPMDPLKQTHNTHNELTTAYTNKLKGFVYVCA